MFGFGWLKPKKARFHEEFSALLKEADRLARSFSQDYIGVEHVVLALRTLPQDHSILKIVGQLGIDVKTYFDRLELSARTLGVCVVKSPPWLPRTPRLNLILKRAAEWNSERLITCLGFLRAVAYERGSLPARLLTEMYLERVGRYPREALEARLLLCYLLLPGEPLTLKEVSPHSPK